MANETTKATGSRRAILLFVGLGFALSLYLSLSFGRKADLSEPAVPSTIPPVAPSASDANKPTELENEIRFNPMDFIRHSLDMRKFTIRSYGGTVREVKAKAARFGLADSDWFAFGTPSHPLSSAAMSYSQARPSFGDTFTNYYDKRIGWLDFKLDTSKIPQPPGKLNASEFRVYAKQVFATNGLTVVHLDANSTAFLLTTNLSKFVSSKP